MVTLSRFSHVFDLGDSVAMYHSLRMKPVFLSKKKYNQILLNLKSNNWSTPDSVPEGIRVEVKELVKYKILSLETSDDTKTLDFVRTRVPSPALSVCYFILSEQCNLACKYCFLGNNDPKQRERFVLESMTKEIAEDSLQFFINQLELTNKNYSELKPTIIFYGGEPLLNFSVLDYIASRINSLRDSKKVIQNAELSIVTNGILLTKEKILRLKELNVGIAISIDGCSDDANEMRVDKSGKPVFKKIIESLEIISSLGVNASLSVTLSERTIEEKEGILELIKRFNIKSIGFNIMMSDGTFNPTVEYNENASQFIIDLFLELRKIGVYEDRIMRKLKSFSKSQIYFSDCAATSGSQLVFTPDGEIGICHGCLSSRDYFISNIHDRKFDMRSNPQIIEWSQISPINKEECLDCSALGICGGGCPINARNLQEGNTIHSMDERFCIHAKKTLSFLISDLYRIVKEQQLANE